RNCGNLGRFLFGSRTHYAAIFPSGHIIDGNTVVARISDPKAALSFTASLFILIAVFMPRGIKLEPSVSGEQPGKGDATAKGTKGIKAKPTALAVNKVALKKKDGLKEGLKATASGAEGGIDIAELEKKRKEFSEQLRKCELQIHRLETQYFETANPQGNALKVGYEGLLSSTAVSAKKAQFRPEDRIFSGSSTTGSAAASS
ncbi:hypothetical protein VaNZ11_016580, partial [Volvox africanus]